MKSGRNVRRSRRTQRGAIFVETLIALPVVIYFALITFQLLDLQMASMVARHAASTTARAAAVIGPDERAYFNMQAINTPNTGERFEEIKKVAYEVLWHHPHFRHDDFSVTLTGDFSIGSMITARVTSRYHCLVPQLNAVCAFQGSRNVTAEASFPYQAAQTTWE